MSSDSLPFTIPASRLSTRAAEATTLFHELRKPSAAIFSCLGLSRGRRAGCGAGCISWACISTWSPAGRRKTFGVGCFAWRTTRRETGRKLMSGVLRHRWIRKSSQVAGFNARAGGPQKRKVPASGECASRADGGRARLLVAAGRRPTLSGDRRSIGPGHFHGWGNSGPGRKKISGEVQCVNFPEN